MASLSRSPEPIDECRKVVGEGHARPAGPEDAVDGVMPRAVIAPGSVDEASQVLRLAHSRGWKVVPRGGGSKLGWGRRPSDLDLVLSTARLDRLVEHAAGDLVVTAEAGLRVRDLQARLAPHGQRLALDPPEAGATLGGLMATGSSGPRRLRFGSARDLLLGLTVVLADGTVARAGGKVVKNVAGYDLGKLFTGSLGTLGLIVQATFRLHPQPAAQRTVRIEAARPADAGAVVQSLLHSPLVPSALELCWPRGASAVVLAVLFEGTETGALSRARAAAGLVAGHGAAAVLDDAAAQRLWDETTPGPVAADQARLKVRFPPAELPQALEAIAHACEPLDGPARLAGHAGCGILFVDVAGGDAALAAGAIQALRRSPALREGGLSVLDAPAALKATVDVWEDPGNALPLLRRVKEQFDPARVLSPGRFVGGL